MNAATSRHTWGAHGSVLRGVFAAGCLTFGALALAITGRPPTALDIAVRSAVVRATPSPWLHDVCGALSSLGSVFVLGPVACVAVVALWRRRTNHSAARAGMLSMASVMLTWALKVWFHRTRPPGAILLPGLGFSFPSGHSLQTMAIGVTLTYVLYREDSAPRWSPYAAVLFSLAVGMSRVCLDVHWATDVVAGWSGGVVVAAGCALLYESSRRPRDMSHRTL